jgi:hypothetical protein
MAAVVFVAIAASSLAAQGGHPSFSGTWILDTARSDKSSFTPQSATYHVTQLGDSLILDRETAGTGKAHMVYELTGKPRTNTLPLIGLSTAATSTVSWHGDSLVVHTLSHPQDADLVQTDIWVLANGGRELRLKRDAVYAGSSMGSPTLVFIKQ